MNEVNIPLMCIVYEKCTCTDFMKINSPYCPKQKLVNILIFNDYMNESF